jgi:creatinine amidohydrolase
MKLAPLILCVALIPSNTTAQILELAELNTEQIKSLDRAKTVVIMPGGILEEHGPYLPSFSDGYNNVGLARRLAQAVVARLGWTAVMFPVIPLGAGGANEIGGKNVFPGTYAVRTDTLRAIFMDLATELGEQGFRWIFVLHGHGAPKHMAALHQAAEYFNDTYGGAMVNLLGLRAFGACFEAGKDLLTAEQQREDGFTVHAGAEEHSLILYLRPDLVPAAIRNAAPVTATSPADLGRLGRAPDWPGYFGSPRLASAARGVRVFEACAGNAVGAALKILDGLDHGSLPRYADRVGADPAAENSLAYERQVEAKQKNWLRKKGLQ